MEITLDEIERITIEAIQKRSIGKGYVRNITITRDGGQEVEIHLFSMRRDDSGCLRFRPEGESL